ncbi:hypothetical protein [Bacillus sp. PK3_68]|uniref:hypothetical protein n=1 Tax=Bacillus sp. PK3_68 TaxID=2027408 RepID=UPI00115EF9FF|nr:hypothetical protein [Bacillus sp. PK3_68]
MLRKKIGETNEKNNGSRSSARFLAACQFGMPEPTKPVIAAGKEKVEYQIGSYSWSQNGKGVEADTAGPEELVKNIDYSTVPAGSNVVIKFNYSPSHMEGWKRPTY